jgi:6-phosphogluconate dehydrogenase
MIVNNFPPKSLDLIVDKREISRHLINRVAWVSSYLVLVVSRIFPAFGAESEKMADAALSHQFEIGIVGLESSGRVLARTLAGNGWRVAAFDRNAHNVKLLQEEAAGTPVHIVPDVKDLAGLLNPFRTILFCAVDADGDLLREVLDQLTALDLVIDGSHCYFKDCERRAELLAERNLRHLEVAAISGADQGSGGPILMAGGRAETYLAARPVLQSMVGSGLGAAHLGYLGPGAAAHFVKMIHDGVEYGLAQLALETFDLLTQASDLDDAGLRDVAANWPVGIRQNRSRDDAARWTAQMAREVGTPAPTIDAAAGTRTLTDLERQNDFATTPFRQPVGRFGDDTESVIAELNGALNAAVMITYAEAVAAMAAGSERHGFGLDVPEVVRLWKECQCPRGALLEDMAATIEGMPNLANLLDDDDFSEKVMEQQERLRHAVWRAGSLRMAVPALTASLDFLDAFRSAWLPVNLIQVPPTRRNRRTELPAQFLRRDPLGTLSAIDEE